MLEFLAREMGMPMQHIVDRIIASKNVFTAQDGISIPPASWRLPSAGLMRIVVIRCAR